MGSLASVLNALASSTIADFWRPWRAGRGRGAEAEARAEAWASQLAVLGWSIALSLFACVCVYWQRASGQALIDFALGVMVFAYTGLLGVYLTALFTRRGNPTSVIAALLAGLGTAVGLLATDLAMPWHMLIGTSISFITCCVGRPSRQRSSPPSLHPTVASPPPQIPRPLQVLPARERNPTR
jgi:Na+/proline symporter